MKKLLFHVSDYNEKILDPSNYKEKCICLSKNRFISEMGRFVYIFDYGVLTQNFNIQKRPTEGYCGLYNLNYKFYDESFRYESQSLQWEYRIYKSIDVEKFAIGIAENFSVKIGSLAHYMSDKLNKIIKIRMNEIDRIKFTDTVKINQ